MASQQLVCAQEPLRVEVIGGSHPNLAPVVLRVKNVTAHTIDLPIPYNVQKNARDNFRNPLPVDIEKLEKSRWLSCRSVTRGGLSRKIEPGKTIDFTLEVLGAGQYRARIWYTIDNGSPPSASAESRVR